MTVKNKAICLFVALAVITIALFAVESYNIKSEYLKYTENDIEFEQLTADPYKIKDFSIENGIITSLSDDPWIEYSSPTGDIRTIDFNISSLSENYTKSEIFLTHSNGSMTRLATTFKQGKNCVNIYDNANDIIALRFDLLTGANQQIGVDSIVINSAESMSAVINNSINYELLEAWQKITLYLPLLLGLIAVCVLIKLKNGKIKPTTAKLYAGGVIFLAVICILISVFGSKYIYKYTSAGLSDLVANDEFVHDFRVLDNRLMSISDDPWITYKANDLNTIRTVTINLGAKTDVETNPSLFIMYNEKGTDLQEIYLQLHPGENTVVIPKTSKNIVSLRFDLTAQTGDIIKLESIEFNKPTALNSYIFDNLLSQYSKMFLWVIFIFLAVYSVIFGKKHIAKTTNEKLDSFLLKRSHLIIAFLLLIAFYISIISPLFVFLPLCAIGYYTGRFAGVEPMGRCGKRFCYAVLLSVTLAIYFALPTTGINTLMFNVGTEFRLRIFLVVICAFVISLVTALLHFENSNKTSSYTLNTSAIGSIFADLCAILIGTLALEALPHLFFDEISISKAITVILGEPNLSLNLLLVAVLYYLFKGIAGDIIGRFLSLLLYALVFLGNYIKLRFHDTILKPMDLLQIGDFLSIATRYVKPVIFYGGIIVLVILIVLIIIRLRKVIARHKINICLGVTSLVMMLTLINMIQTNKFVDMGIDVTQLWSGTESCVDNQGLIGYTYINVVSLSDFYPNASQNYSQEEMEEFKKEFEALRQNKTDDVKPNVIVVMEESLFDVSKLNDVTFSIDPTKNQREYAKTNVISPKYGGGTASVEFEALTGLSNMFFLDNIVPYVTYWNNRNKKIPSIVDEFNLNGYTTVAIHPNTASTYNREIVYDCMGFDKFISKEEMDFSGKNLSEDGYFTDDALADVILDEASSIETPSFIFAITIENHTLYENKYSNPDIELSSNLLGDSELHQLEQYSQGVLNADLFIGKMVDAVKEADRPTILYVWGDHLPALDALKTLGFTEDKYNKYTTPLVVYSNYKDIEIDSEYITPNQIATQILYDSNIEHSSYFDYIYSLRALYPVIQKEFAGGVNSSKNQSEVAFDEDTPEIQKYREIQYDLLFGEQYLDTK